MHIQCTIMYIHTIIIYYTHTLQSVTYHGALDKALDSIFNKPKSMFIKTTIRDLFFNGIRFDCSVQDFAGVAVCNALKEKKETLIEESDSIFRYGFLAAVRICALYYTYTVVRLF